MLGVPVYVFGLPMASFEVSLLLSVFLHFTFTFFRNVCRKTNAGRTVLFVFFTFLLWLAIPSTLPLSPACSFLLFFSFLSLPRAVHKGCKRV